MTVYEIPHVTVTDMGNFYKIKTEEGYVLRLPNAEENIYKTVALLAKNYDFSLVEIYDINDLPEDAEILGDTGEPEHEVM